MSCGIYKITNLINGHSYIGQSTNIERRWCNHKNEINKDYPLYRAFKKYGIENFNFSIIELCEVSELDEKEIFYIKKYNTYFDGYNQTLGGGGTIRPVKISDDEIEEIYNLLLNTDISQQEIAKRYSVGEDTISEINQGKTRIKEGLDYPLRDNKKKDNYCPMCGVKILYESKHCDKCNKILHRTIERPSREELKKMIRNESFVQIGKKYNVADNSIRKWCDSYKLPRTKSEIKSYSDEEWNKI